MLTKCPSSARVISITMLIGLISDTHIPDHAKEIPEQVKEVFRGVELILHAGDIYIPSVLDELERLAPVLAAEGDDDPFVTAHDRRVSKRQVLTIEGITIWVVHVRPLPWPWEEEPPDVVIYGHTHEAKLDDHLFVPEDVNEATLEKTNGMLRISPGSPTFPHYKPKLGTVGLLKVSSGKAEAQIIQLK